MANERLGDQTQVALFWDSGTYATTSGAAVWIGMVTNNEINEEMNVISARFAGNASRNVGQFLDGRQSFVGTLQFYPQNFRMLGLALGSMVDGGSPSPYQHLYTETNSNQAVATVPNQSLPTFAIEDFQGADVAGSHFVRTLYGCMVQQYTLRFAEGEPLSCNVNYVGQSVTFSSGAKSSVTADTLRPYMWSDVAVFVPSGTQFSKVKDGEFTINHNTSAPFYIDGNRTIGNPLPLNRDYEFTMTLNTDKTLSKTLYDQYFVGGSTFNALLRAQVSTGSRELFLTFSGCKLVDMGLPTPGEGLVEEKITIRPQSVSAIENNDIIFMNAGSYAGF